MSTSDLMKSINGSLGEMSLEFTLFSLREDGAMFLKNVYIPKADGSTTEIDLIMVYRGEIYVFECKNFSGWIFGNTKNKQWTQSLKGRRGSIKNKFYNPILQNENHIMHLRKLAGDSCKYISIVVFSDKCVFKNVDTIGSGTFVTKRSHVLELVKSIARGKENSSDANRIYNLLYPYAHPSADVKDKHVDYMHKYKQDSIKDSVEKNTDSSLAMKNDSLDIYGLPPRMIPSVAENQLQKSTSKKGIILAISVGVAVLFLGVVLMLLCR